MFLQVSAVLASSFNQFSNNNPHDAPGPEHLGITHTVLKLKQDKI